MGEKMSDEKDPVFEQLAKEIVFFVQNEKHSTQKCIDFVRYELYLRCVSKRKLKEIAQEVEA